MKRTLIRLLCLLPAGALLPAFGQTSVQHRAPKPPQAAVVLSQAESFDFLTDLNNNSKLVAESVFPNVQYKGLKSDNCFGARLANGQRMAGESARDGYGYSGSVTEQGPDGSFGKPLSFQLVGFLYSEFPFSIEGQALPAGPYVLEAFNESLRLVGNDEDAKYFDQARRRSVPGVKTVKLPLKTPILDSYVGKNTTQVAQYSVTVKGGRIVLSLLGNEWEVIPR